MPKKVVVVVTCFKKISERSLLKEWFVWRRRLVSGRLRFSATWRMCSFGMSRNALGIGGAGPRDDSLCTLDGVIYST